MAKQPAAGGEQSSLTAEVSGEVESGVRVPLEGEAVFIVGQNFAFQHLAKEFTGDQIPS